MQRRMLNVYVCESPQTGERRTHVPFTGGTGSAGALRIVHRGLDREDCALPPNVARRTPARKTPRRISAAWASIPSWRIASKTG